MNYIISGIQQMGIGVPSVDTIWPWYRKAFGMDVRVFEDAAEAPLMTKYTGNKVHKRTATLAMSMDGGGGFEIWQFTSRPTEKATFDIKLGDFGLYSCIMKSRDIEHTHTHLSTVAGGKLGDVHSRPNGEQVCTVTDPNGNIFTIANGRGWFTKTNHPSQCGGVGGVIIGVSNIDKALPLYRDILGYETTEYDVTGDFEDFKNYPGGEGQFRRVLLTHRADRKGPFAQLLGPTEIELVQSLDRTDCKPIFENRFWGDWGFIHLCFDLQRMDAFKEACEKAGFPFTVDAGDTFDMGEAGGRFSYIEDPDGTLIEFVETHKVPIVKKIGWSINLKKRNPEKPLPRWMLKAMGIGRVRD